MKIYPIIYQSVQREVYEKAIPLVGADSLYRTGSNTCTDDLPTCSLPLDPHGRLVCYTDSDAINSLLVMRVRSRASLTPSKPSQITYRSGVHVPVLPGL